MELLLLNCRDRDKGKKGGEHEGGWEGKGLERTTFTKHKITTR